MAAQAITAGSKIINGSTKAQLGQQDYAQNRTNRRWRERRARAAAKYKTPEEWDAMYALNKHLDPEFIDSPVITKPRRQWRAHTPAPRFKTAEQIEEMRRLNPHLKEEFLDSPVYTIPRRTVSLPNLLSHTQQASVGTIKKQLVNFVCYALSLFVWVVAAMQIPIIVTGIFTLLVSANPLFRLTPLGLGLELVEYFADVNIAQASALGLFGIVALINAAVLMSILLCLLFMNVKIASGQKAGKKQILLLAGVVGALFQCLPCILFWVRTVRRNPK